jgi:peroxiredoxin
VLKEGVKAPEFTLDQVAGEPVALQELLAADHYVVLIFLRYLG